MTDLTAEQQHVLRHVDLPDEWSECWPWTAATTIDGYGVLVVEHRTVYAHRRSWEVFVDPIPVGLEIDHACHNADLTCPGGNACPHRGCVNPAHLEPVTRRENLRRAHAYRRARLALAG